MNKKLIYIIFISIFIFNISCNKDEGYILLGTYQGVSEFEEVNPNSIDLIYSKLAHYSIFNKEGYLIEDYFDVGVMDTTVWYLNEDTNTFILNRPGTWSGSNEYDLINFDADSIVYEGQIRRTYNGKLMLFNQRTVLVKE